jgi:hypothetical protein
MNLHYLAERTKSIRVPLYVCKGIVGHRFARLSSSSNNNHNDNNNQHTMSVMKSCAHRPQDVRLARLLLLALAVVASLFYLPYLAAVGGETTFKRRQQHQPPLLYYQPQQPPPRVCAISVMLGQYEKTMKEPLEPLHSDAPMFMVTDQEGLLQTSNSAWTPIRLNNSLWQEDCLHYIGARNNPCTNVNPFNLGKFYKTQFYRVPEIQQAGCDVVLWFDGTIRLHDATFFQQMASRADRGQNLITFVHSATRRGTLKAEVEASNFPRYTAPKLNGVAQPPQPVLEQYQDYLAQGFREKWFDASGNMHRPEYGMFVTCMVLFDLRLRITRQFLDCWWNESVVWTTQDQVSFPFCAWKLGVYPHALPDAEVWGTVQSNSLFEKLGHGQ